MTAAVAEQADLRALSDDELAALYGDASEDVQADILAVMESRDRSDRARKAAASRNAEWESAAYSQYQAILALGWSSGLLSEAGKRKGREPWPMLWQGNEQDARLLASDEVLRYWDHTEPRTPPPGEYAAAKRAAQAEYDARERDALGIDDQPERKRTPRATWERVTGGFVRAVSVRLGKVTAEAWAAKDAIGNVVIQPSRERAEQHLAPAPPPAPTVTAEPPMPDFASDPAAFRDWLNIVHALRAERRAQLLTTAKGLSR